jgi:hypothetical protein
VSDSTKGIHGEIRSKNYHIDRFENAHKQQKIKQQVKCYDLSVSNSWALIVDKIHREDVIPQSV